MPRWPARASSRSWRRSAQRIAGAQPDAGRAAALDPRASPRRMQVSKSTVVEAYDRLAAEGIIRSRPGSGFYVAGHSPPLSLAEIGPKLDRAIDPFWVSRQSLEAGDEMLKPGCGWLPPSWMPEEALRRALRALARAPTTPTLTDYGTPLGLPPLRQLLARRLAEHGIEASPDQIMLTESGTQAIDLALPLPDRARRHGAGRRSLLFQLPRHAARPSRQDRQRALHARRARTSRLFAQALAEHRPRLYITNSALHNPTGATLSPVDAHRLLKLADQHGLTIIEDDIFADFEHEPAPRLAAFDGLDRVIHIGSFSKTLSASVRCGFIAAPRRLDRRPDRPQDRHLLRRRPALGRAGADAS